MGDCSPVNLAAWLSSCLHKLSCNSRNKFNLVANRSATFAIKRYIPLASASFISITNKSEAWKKRYVYKEACLQSNLRLTAVHLLELAGVNIIFTLNIIWGLNLKRVFEHQRDVKNISFICFNGPGSTTTNSVNPWTRECAPHVGPLNGV